METYKINKEEMQVINNLLTSMDYFSHPLHSPDNYAFFKLLTMYAHRLPERLVEFLIKFKYEENNEGVCLLKGYAVDRDRIASTPDHWRNDEAALRTKRESLFLLLCSALVGDAIGWSTQQDGKIVHDIVPIKGDEYKQVGSSTLTELWWHTEEAFHPCRCDYLALLCLKNNEKACTTYASVHSLNIDARDKETLFNPHFSIYPDSSHLAAANGNGEVHEGILKMNQSPDKIAVLFGDFKSPYLCIDPFYMEKNIQNAEAERALGSIINEINKNLQRVTLEPGDILFLDNYRVVHGREAFHAFYDGSGRWLKRVNIVRDLRKSRALRNYYESRIIETA